MILADSLPGLGELISGISPPIRFVVIPLAVAVFGTQAAPDGRAAHRFGWDWLRFRLRARRRSSGRVVALEGEPVHWDGELALRADGEGPELRHGRVLGPARITFNVPIRLSDRGGRLVARPAAEGERGDAVVLCPGARLELRP
jgi:hypothetical protein